MLSKFRPKKNDNLTSNCFIVACHGWSGSHWFSYSLNLHENILCTHSASNLVSESTTMHSNENLKIRSKERYDNIKRKIAYQKSIDEYYDEIVKEGDKLFYGSVHLFQLKDISALTKKFGLRRKYQIINQVRHPISFVWSGYGQLKDLFKIDLWVLKGTLDLIFSTGEDFIFTLIDDYRLDICDLENIAFIGSCANLINLGYDVESFPNVNFVPMERLTSDVEYFRGIVNELTLNKLDISDNYLDKVFKIGELNKHRHDNVTNNPQARFESWEQWQKSVFKFYLEKSKIGDKYTKIGYDLTYINL